MGLAATVALILVVGPSLAAWRALRLLDPPYRGLHRPGVGRHRLPDWADRSTSPDVD